MKSSGFSKSSYALSAKLHAFSAHETNFKDDNLRDPRYYEKNNGLTDLSSEKYSSDVLDTVPRNTHMSKGGLDLPSPPSLGGSKSQMGMLGFHKQKKLKPIGKSGDISSTNIQSDEFKPIDFGLSDFYLKNFLIKQRGDNEGKKGTSFNQNSTFLEPMSPKNSTLDTRKAKSPTKQVSAELAQIVSGQSLKLKFFDSLGPSCKEFYLDKKDFIKVFDDVDIAMFCLEEVIQRLKCYRFELGALLDKVGFSFKKIMEKFLDLTMKISSEKDFLHDKKMEENFNGIKLLENEKKALEEKNKQYKNLSDVTESEANIYKFNVKSLQNEVSMLYELLKKDYLVQDKPDKLDDPNMLRGNRFQEMVEPSKQLAKNLLTLQESIKHLETEQSAKEEKLQEMNNLLKAMLRGGKKEVGTQVDEGELAWAAKNIINMDGMKPKASDFETYESAAVNLDPQLEKELENEENLEGVDPVHILKFKEKKEKKDSAETIQLEQTTKPTGGKGGALTVNIPQPTANNVENWNLPLSIIVFLENVTKGNKTANILPWPFFKRVIFEVYQDKIANNFEINNSLINTSTSMSDFLPIYFLKTYRLRRTAELKLLEFCVSIKYYMKTWQRAATFANICNISNIKLDKDGISSSKFPDFDIYAQSFFLFAFTRATSDFDSIYDNADGLSYLAKEKIEDLTNEVLSFENEANRKKFIGNLSKFSKSYTDNGKEREGVDIDRLLSLYMETYFEVKTRNIQTITKYFYKQQSNGEGVFSLDEVYQLVAEIIDVESPLVGYTYPKELSVCRAFLYSLTSGKNTFSINYKDFLQAISRFGIDCPFPFLNAATQAKGTVSLATLTSDDKKKGNNSPKKVASPTGGKVPMNSKGAETPKKEDEMSSRGSPKNSVVGQDNKDSKKKKEDEKAQNFKLDAASSLFTQHFSILRELKTYCAQFKDMLGKESDVEKVWKGFEQISSALEAGCQFLSYPVTM